MTKAVEKVIEEFEKLPGVGPKSAARMAYHYLRSPNKDASALAEALIEMDQKVVFCQKCFNVSETSECEICSTPLRDSHKICIVEEPLDVVAFEKAGIFNGLYFVLGGVISPADGIGPEELRMVHMTRRISQLYEEHKQLEVIIATNPSLEGEATASFIHEAIRNISDDIQVTRLAMGLPTGADLEYADRTTLLRALEGRRAV